MSEVPRCVYCRTRPAAPEWRPFCSERCKMADLGRWLTGGYRIPSRDNEDGDGEAGGGPAEADDE